MLTLKSLRGTTALDVYAPPVHFWQSVQWQSAERGQKGARSDGVGKLVPVVAGLPANSYLTAPHMQDPVVVMVAVKVTSQKVFYV